jgi:glycosyltransferase involved in cell wall biosynthesis
MEETTPSLPRVSICTPTFNRRPFIPYLLTCIQQQTYPAELIEWIIVDDGTDTIEDLFPIERGSWIKYFRYDTKMTLGMKRNLLHTKCTGSIIIYMDDDDYYPPTRVSSAVEALLSNPTYLIAGCLELPIYYHAKETIYLMGPYGENRITAATFAFKRQLLYITTYNETECISEERFFLKNYSIPVIPLDPIHTILVVSHPHNSIDKNTLLTHTDTKGAENKFVKISHLKACHFIQDPAMYQFYITTLYDVLYKYDYGKADYKPDVLLGIKDAQISRLSNKLQLLTMENERLTNLNKKLREMVLSNINQTNNKPK